MFLISESTEQKLRQNNGQPLSWENINTFCRSLPCQPFDIIGYVPETGLSVKLSLAKDQF
ncbi:MAG: helix-turn-helix domain-containing protein [Clostridia bacterium]|nr:helix-turn-helix domain-containing protein [Clostridia bacterium]